MLELLRQFQRHYGIKNCKLKFPTYSDVDNLQKRQPLPSETLNASPINIDNPVIHTKSLPYEGQPRLPVICRKLGMMTLYDEEWGAAHPVTALQVDHCQVLGARTLHRYVEHADPDATEVVITNKECRIVQEVGGGVKSPHQCRRHLQLYYRRCQVSPKLKLVGTPVRDVVAPGTWLRAAHFLPGQFVDITGMTKGKGFQGVMKRHGFAGFPASHGCSLAHRSAGSMGSRRDGKVWRGRKMAGRMGHQQRTVKHMLVMKLDHALDVIYVRGSVPGPRKGFLILKDSRSNPLFKQTPPPYPTFFPILSKDDSNSKKPLSSTNIWLPREVRAPSLCKKDPLYHIESDIK